MTLKIGIPAQDQPDEKFGVNKNYLEFIYQFGFPIIITPTPKEEFLSIYKLDALLLPGGADVNPQRYSKIPFIFNSSSNVYLEHFDNEILPLFLGNIPIFGICRGLQTLNVAFRGTLKNLWYHPYSDYDEHAVHEVKESGVEKGTKFKVNSFHHQAIANLASNFKKEMETPDGIIEAISDWSRNIFAVQWHPERLKDGYSFKKFREILK